ncbi:MAG: RNA 2',3'-cyclic phosphodiesterase [Tuberibacillus sp.]
MSHYFLAVPIPDEVKTHLRELSKNLQDQFHYGYWTDREDFHITLLFLGEADTSQIDALVKCLHDKTKNISGSHIALKGFGTFGKKTEPRVLWMGIDYDNHLSDLYAAVRDCVSANGFAVESRPYRPHITIAKKWRGQNPVNQEQWESAVPDFQPFTWKTGEFILYKVEPGRTPRYIPIEHFPLDV